MVEKHADLIQVLETVCDPELPMVSIKEMGILRRIEQKEETLEVVITPSFTGCPAIDEIEKNIRDVLNQNQVKHFRVVHELTPTWSSTDITPTGRQKLIAHGIAVADEGVYCPQCQSIDTVIISPFGSTACKSVARCQSCKEPFEVFKSVH